MKKLIILITFCVVNVSMQAQTQEVKQLLLNVEKLLQFRKILDNMYDGYKVLHSGYSTIKDISEGNFNLHKQFLDRLLEVNPVVRKYKRVADIISGQIRLVKEYKTALIHFRNSKRFTDKEIEFMERLYSGLLNGSLKNLDELATIMTAGKVRMSDDERLQAIDRIYSGIEDQLDFLSEFNKSTYTLMYQREKEQMEINQSRKTLGLN